MKTLSDKIEEVADSCYPQPVIEVRDVKEFIKRLKERLHEDFDFVSECAHCQNNIDNIIDKIAGEKLI